MAEKKKLFEKSTDELREAFVKARFAQEDIFGRADIEEWLNGQWGAERPEYDHAVDESYWNTVLTGDYMMWIARENSLVVLRERATSCQTLDHLRNPQVPSNEFPLPFKDDVFIQFIPLFTKFATKARVYYGYTSGAIIVAPDMVGNPHSYTVRADGEAHGCSLVIEPFETNLLRASIFVVDAIFAEWLYGRSKWLEARQFLCDALADEIAKERAKAEDDFNRAVAVSADGTKIVCADEVIVVDREGNTRSFPPKVFATNKILRDSLLSRHYADSFDWLNKWNETKVDFYGKPQFFVRIEYEDKTYLITSERFCPDPLPEGGVELKV